MSEHEIYDAPSVAKFLGGDSSGETPVPIPNTEVKLATLKILGWLRPGKISTAKIKKASAHQK